MDSIRIKWLKTSDWVFHQGEHAFYHLIVTGKNRQKDALSTTKPAFKQQAVDNGKISENCVHLLQINAIG